MTPSFHDLTYFVEVAASLNLSRGAERLGITQPSLTLAIQRLEAAVGAPLLIRSKKGVTLTQAGKQLHSHARDLIQRWHSVKSRAMASMSDVQGSYTIGCHPSVAIYTLPSILPQLLEKHPGLELKLVHDLSRRIAEQVIRMEIDVGIVVNPVRHPDLVIRKLYDDDVGLWVGPGKHKIQDPRSGHAVLICDPDLLQTQTLLKQLKANEISFSRTLASSNLEVITQLTAAGCGIGVLPDRVAMTASKRGLRRVARGPAFHDEVCVLYRTENRNVRAILTLAEAVAAGKS